MTTMRQGLSAWVCQECLAKELAAHAEQANPRVRAGESIAVVPAISQVGMPYQGVDRPGTQVRLLKEQLAASEKERELLKGELEFTKKMLERAPKASGQTIAANEELRRELENLKRSTNNTIGDQFGYIGRLEKDNSDAAVRIAFLERELERLRSKKRGL